MLSPTSPYPGFEAKLDRLLLTTVGVAPGEASAGELMQATAGVARSQLSERWVQTQAAERADKARRVYYLSMEFLIGRTLGNALAALNLHDDAASALSAHAAQLEDVAEREADAALGNGGLGRLAACFLDSMATLGLPSFGYGIRYEYGMFYQRIVNGCQVEVPDNWLRYGNPWEFDRQEHLHKIQYQGRVVEYTGEQGNTCYSWIDTHDVMALAYDVPIPGYGNDTVNTMRLWSAKSTRDFELESFNRGNYIGAVESKMKTENISKVLYPADDQSAGKELRLKQQYFFVSATLQDVVRRFKKRHIWQWEEWNLRNIF